MNASRLGICLMLTVSTGAQERTDWLQVARHIGGSATPVADRYVRLIPSQGWHPELSPRIWLQLRDGRDATNLHASIPVRRDAAATARAVLAEALPRDTSIEELDTFGADSPRMHLIVRARGAPLRLAIGFRDALEHIDPGAIARIDVVGVVEADSFECEDGVVIRTGSGERIGAGRLLPDLRRVGTTVHLVAQRSGLRHDRFYYYGTRGHWRSIARAVRVTRAAPTPERRATMSDEAARAWQARCIEHAHTVLDDPRLIDARVRQPFAIGFAKRYAPSRPVCPYCERLLVVDRSLPRDEHDLADAALLCCPHDRVYFLNRDGDPFGPFDPDQNRERTPR